MPRKPKKNGQTIRITIIDDCSEAIGSLIQALDGHRFAIQAITTTPFFGEEIEAEIKEFNPDLIILDLLLSDTIDSGFRVLCRIKASALLCGIPVLISSKFINDDESGSKLRVQAIEFGAVDAISKNAILNAELFLRFSKRLVADGGK